MSYRTALTLAATLLASPAVAAPEMQEGLWEVTTKVEMAGMPAGMPSQVVQQCITRNDLKDPRNAAPRGGPAGDCKVTDYKLQGNSASWNVACAGEGAMTGSGTMTFGATTYSGTTRMRMQGQPQEITMHYSGRRIGECRK